MPTNESKCGSCFRPPVVRATFASPDPKVDGSTDLACDVHRDMYQVGTVFPAIPALIDYPAIPEFTVTAVTDLPDPAIVAGISNTVRTFLDDAQARQDGTARTEAQAAEFALSYAALRDAPDGTAVRLPGGPGVLLVSRSPSITPGYIGELVMRDLETGEMCYLYAVPELTLVQVLSAPTDVPAAPVGLTAI